MAIKLTAIEDLQHDFDGLIVALHLSRQFGKTKAAVKLAGDVGGLLVVRTTDEARLISRQYGVDTAPVTNIQGSVRGKDRPVVLDQDAMLYMLEAAVGELGRTRNIIKHAHQRLNTGHSRSCNFDPKRHRDTSMCNCGHKELEDAMYGYKIGNAGETF